MSQEANNLLIDGNDLYGRASPMQSAFVFIRQIRGPKSEASSSSHIAWHPTTWLFDDGPWTIEPYANDVTPTTLYPCLLSFTPLPEVLFPLVYAYARWRPVESRTIPQGRVTRQIVYSGLGEMNVDAYIGPVYFESSSMRATDWMNIPFNRQQPTWQHPLHLPTPVFDEACLRHGMPSQAYAVLLAMLGALLDGSSANSRKPPFAPFVPLVFGRAGTGKTSLIRRCIEAIQDRDVLTLDCHDSLKDIESKFFASTVHHLSWHMYEFGRDPLGGGATPFFDKHMATLARGGGASLCKDRTMPGFLVAAKCNLGSHVVQHAPHLLCFEMNKPLKNFNTRFEDLVRKELPMLIRKSILLKQHLQHYLDEHQLELDQFVSHMPYFTRTRAVYVQACNVSSALSLSLSS
jgi:hypothetical protein